MFKLRLFSVFGKYGQSFLRIWWFAITFILRIWWFAFTFILCIWWQRKVLLPLLGKYAQCKSVHRFMPVLCFSTELHFCMFKECEQFHFMCSARAHCFQSLYQARGSQTIPRYFFFNCLPYLWKAQYFKKLYVCLQLELRPKRNNLLTCSL